MAPSCTVRSALAQCGAKHSACSACHDGVKAPSPSLEAWHEDHRFADVCVSCHGGDGDAKGLAEAHAAMVPPLVEGTARCVECHGAAAPSFLERYRSRRVLDAGDGGGASIARDEGRPPQHGSTNDPVRDAGDPHRGNALLLAFIGVVGAVGGALVLRQERGRRRLESASSSPAGGGAGR